MKILHPKSLSAILLLIFFSMNTLAQKDLKRSTLFDSDWLFHRGGALGAEDPEFDDSKWMVTEIPHDWSIEDLPGTKSPFNIDAISQVNGGFTTGGTGWYRKRFSISPELKDKELIIMFEGVYMNASVWVNGKPLGSHPYGYTSFWYDITALVNPDKENTLAVKVMNEGENSRWYSGSGIYRHVWLYSLPQVHATPWGTSITTPEVNEKTATVRIKTSVANSLHESSKISVKTTIYGPNGEQTVVTTNEETLNADAKAEITQDFKISNPALWSTDKPQLYNAVTEIISGSLSDRTETEFGIRSVSFDAVNGLLLNGKKLKLKGGCLHHDNGILGSKAYDRAEERRVELLKANGFNAVRCAHNPPSPAFLKACDHLGMLVMDEAFDMWNEGKNPADYHLYFNEWWKEDIKSMIYRDRNHPSIILWSIGNEIPDRQNPEVIDLAGKLAAWIRELDPTRPITSAVNDLGPHQDPYFSKLDICGYNYAAGGDHNKKDLYEIDHERMPKRIMIGTESYPLEAFGSWMPVLDHPYLIGDFVWTAFDYIGEASIGWRGYFQKQNFFPWNLAYCGDIDICGWKRAQSYYRDVLWKDNQLSIWVTPPQPSFPLNPQRESWSKWHWYDVTDDWNWNDNEGKAMEVIVYSSCETVELFLNNKSLGKQPTNRSTEFIAKFSVPFSKGTLKAIGYNQKKQVATAELHSTGEPVHLALSADKKVINAGGQDLSYVTVELTDDANYRNPKADNLVTFELTGPGIIEGTGNANPVSLESFRQPFRKGWRGRCMVIVRSGKTPGKIILKASSPGLTSQSVEIESK